MSPMWAKWRCAGCASLLGIDTRRRLLAIFVWVPAVAGTLVLANRSGLGYPVSLPTLVVLGALIFRLIERAVVLERCGFRCRQCGYDLRGQGDPYCPECGRGFDAAEVAQMSSSDPAGVAQPAKRTGRRSSFILLALIIIVVVTQVILGIVVHRRKTAAPAVVPTQQSAPAAPSSPAPPP